MLNLNQICKIAGLPIDVILSLEGEDTIETQEEFDRLTTYVCVWTRYEDGEAQGHKLIRKDNLVDFAKSCCGEYDEYSLDVIWHDEGTSVKGIDIMPTVDCVEVVTCKGDAYYVFNCEE